MAIQLPWRISGKYIEDAEGGIMAYIGGDDVEYEQLRELIVTAVNAHESLKAENKRLREALKKAVHELNEIRARDGVPYTHELIKSSVCPEYFASVVDECNDALAAEA